MISDCMLKSVTKLTLNCSPIYNYKAQKEIHWPRYISTLKHLINTNLIMDYTESSFN